MTAADIPPYMGVTHVYRVLHVGRHTLNRMIKDGKFPAPDETTDAGHRKWLRPKLEAELRRRGELAAERGAA